MPKARSSEIFCFGAAGVGAFAPFYMMLPGANERLASQTARWAPRWERNITFFVSPVERGIQRVSPPIERTVQRIDRKLPLEKMAKNIDSRIKKGIDRASRQ
jgi:hypothetical protein